MARPNNHARRHRNPANTPRGGEFDADASPARPAIFWLRLRGTTTISAQPGWPHPTNRSPAASVLAELAAAGEIAGRRLEGPWISRAALVEEHLSRGLKAMWSRR